MTFDVGEQLLLERQILQDRFDDVIGFAHGFGEFEAWPHPRDRQRVVAEVAQIGGDRAW